MSNILIIGGAGFIGSNLIKSLQDSHNIFVYDIQDVTNSRQEQFKYTVPIFYGKLNNHDYLFRVLEENLIDTIIHLASGILPGSLRKEYFKEYITVIIPTIKLLQFSSAHKIKIIFFSSGGTIYGLTQSQKVKESVRACPICYYGFSKQILEDSIMFEHRTSGLDYLIIRPSNPYGPGQNIQGKQGLISTSIGKILNNKKIVIWGDGNIVRDYFYIDNLSYAIRELIQLNVKNEIFNIGSGKGYSVNEILLELRNLTNIDFNVEYTVGRAVDVPYLVLDNSKLKRFIPFSPTSLKAGLKQFFNYLKEAQ